MVWCREERGCEGCRGVLGWVWGGVERCGGVGREGCGEVWRGVQRCAEEGVQGCAEGGVRRGGEVCGGVRGCAGVGITVEEDDDTASWTFGCVGNARTLMQYCI